MVMQRFLGGWVLERGLLGWREEDMLNAGRRTDMSRIDEQGVSMPGNSFLSDKLAMSFRRIAIVGLAVFGCFCFCGWANAQFRGGGLAVAPIESSQEGTVSDSEGAGIKTDPELESILKKADQFREEGNYRIAAKYWQTVLEKSGDALFSDDEKVYFSLASRVEEMIAKLPAEGLQMYRITADGDAKEILAEAQGADRVAGLSQVVKRFFISSEGDDAAYELAGVYLDRFDFVGAIRLYRKIIETYPDPSVDLGKVWLRLALCYAYVGNGEAAREALAEARKLADDPDGPEFAQIAAATGNAEEYVPENAAAARRWTMRLGGPERTGLMPTFPLDMFEQDLQPVWSFAVAPEKRYDWEKLQGRIATEFTPEFEEESEAELIELWARNGWQPAGELLFDDEHVFFKTQADLTAWDLTANSDQVAWRPLWMNVFDWDGASLVWKQLIQYNRIGKMAKDSYPNELDRAFHFGDRIHQSMSLINSHVYTIEGKEYSEGDRISKQFKRGNYNWGSMPRRTRTNYLTCYDAKSGKFAWRFPPLEFDEAGTTSEVSPDPADETDMDIGFMSGPIAYGNLLLLPVNSGGSIWVYALDAENQGKRVWRSFLCDEPSTGSKEWAPIHMTLAGSDLYVNCGYGAFFALDPATGSVRFARRYPRTGESNANIRNAGIQGNLLELEGFDEDILLPYGNQLILLASDHRMILGFNRQTGELIWEAPTKDVFGTSVNYLIGVHDEILYAGGTDNVIAYDLEGEGRMIWTIDHHLEGKLCGGRAMLTSDGVFVPVGKTIIRFDLRTGKPLQKVGVRLRGNSPVGNLYSDGNKIWLLNGPRLVALGPVQPAASDGEEGETSDGQ